MKALIIISIFLTNLASAEIRQSMVMEDVEAEVNLDTLVVLDLDNTVMEPEQTIGSDQWYKFLVRHYIINGYELNDAIDKAIVVWQDVQRKTKMMLVENSTSSFITTLQDKGIRVIGLTARPVNLVRTTLKQLDRLEIDFSYNNEDLKLGPIKAKHRSVLNRGVIFVGPKNNKGLVLSKFLKKNKIHSQKIIFVDDKLKHVTNVEKSLAAQNISYIGFRYGAADQKVRSFSKEIAKVQLDVFKERQEIISDYQACLKTDAYRCD